MDTVNKKQISYRLEIQKVDIQNEHFYVRFLANRLECSIHQYRCRASASNELKIQLVSNLSKFAEAVKEYGLFQPRLYHYQSYYAYLRKKSNRAKLLLEDCRVASKNLDVGFELEWCMASLRTWFAEDNEDMDLEMQLAGSNVKYILPIPQ